MKYREGFSERMGRYPAVSEGGKRPLWVHAVSVGEVQAAWPLVREARRKGWKDPVVLTTITRTGRKMAENLIGTDADMMAYYPWDAPWVAERAIESLNPAAFVTVETEVWPNLVFGLARRGIPAFIANGRFSERSFRKAMSNRPFWRDVMSTFSLIMVRGGDDASRLMELGLDPSRVIVDGDCKVDALLLRIGRSNPREIRKSIGAGDAPILLAGSTHRGEESAVLEAFREARNRFPDVRLIIAPRHPERSHEVELLAKGSGRVCRLSKLENGWDVLVVDRVGVLFGLYGVACSAFVGGSLVPKGGQNILEPAAWGVSIRHGPHMEDFRPHADALGKLGAAVTVANAPDLAGTWMKDLSDKENPGMPGRSYVEGLGGASSLSWERIRGILKIRE
ncbi:MAG: glycosyltransferase N-terminal domain-containing protein [Thermovirgaceae bacterium]|nr:glycosyltransferase N-terminal domain-containing protein [Thermovirgaceae bacterium]